MISNLKALIKAKRQELARFFKFCVVGTIGTGVDFGLFNVFHNWIGFHEVAANTISVSAAIMNNYTWSRFWVYPETKHHQGGKKLLQFVVVSLIAWGLNTGILWGADRWVFGEAGLLSSLVSPVALAIGIEHGVLSSNTAKVIATGIVLFWNFFANRLWTFRDVDDVSQATQPAADQL